MLERRPDRVGRTLVVEGHPAMGDPVELVLGECLQPGPVDPTQLSD
jgi:hypothetical protein